MPLFLCRRIWMSSVLHTLSYTHWHPVPSYDDTESITAALESGKIIFLPSLHFDMRAHEKALLSPKLANHKRKNISFNSHNLSLQGAIATPAQKETLEIFMKRFSTEAAHLVRLLFPCYAKALQKGRTSFRPVETAGRKPVSYKKDDTRLHIDAFPASPNQGKRILRVFCNINPSHDPRVWRVGETFEDVAKRFLPAIPKPLPLTRHMLKLLKITKSFRTNYDHVMLHLHDKMKGDKDYQKNINFTEIQFPSHSTWIVFSDQVSHAALAGQHLLEQTFYLPIHAMQDETKSPLRILEKLTHKSLCE